MPVQQRAFGTPVPQALVGTINHLGDLERLVPLGFAYTRLAHYNGHDLQRRMAGDCTTTGPSQGCCLIDRPIHAKSCGLPVCQMHQEKSV